MRFLKWASGILGAALFVTMAIILVINPQIPITVTQQQIQAGVDSVLPLEKTQSGLTILVKRDTQVKLLASGQIGVTANFEAKPTLTKTTRYVGNLEASSELLYRRGAFYLSNLTLDSLTGEWMTSERAKSAGRIAGKFLDKLQERFDIDPNDTNVWIDDIKARGPDMLSNRLSQIPVFKLNSLGWKGFLADKALDDIKVTQAELTATLSLRSFIVWLLAAIGIAMLALAFAIGLVWSGGAGFALMAIGN